jgi:hypothetical protein
MLDQKAAAATRAILDIPVVQEQMELDFRVQLDQLGREVLHQATGDLLDLQVAQVLAMQAVKATLDHRDQLDMLVVQ